MNKIGFWWLVILLAMACAACVPKEYPTPILVTSTPMSIIQERPLPIMPSEAASVELFLIGDAQATPAPVDTAIQLVDPLRFTFPQAETQTLSTWRPPLYPVPWEPTPFDHFYFIRPIGANTVSEPLERYRYGGVFNFGSAHTGIDIPAPEGTPVFAAGPGKVVWAGYGLYLVSEPYRDPYGIAVAIQHDFGYQGGILYTIYAHLSEHKVFRGQRVESGDIIGLVGKTGNASGPHLHFEVRVGRNDYFGSRNPELWIAPPQGWGVLVGRVMDSNGSLLKKHRVNIRSLDTNQYYYADTYGEGAVNSDDYYKENLVRGDLPAGKYVLWIFFNQVIIEQLIEIKPGMVAYFTFKGKYGYDLTLPPTPTPFLIIETPTATLDK